MLGIKLFKPTPGIPPIPFNYEIRSMRYIELDGDVFIAGGDKAGILKVLRYNGKELSLIEENDFGYKIIGMDFILYGKNEEQLGLMVALEIESNPNLFFNPDIRSREQTESRWHEIKHEHGTPQLVFQPYVMEDLTKIIFSFQSGYFTISNVVQNEKGYYELKGQWDHSFPSRIIDGCVEFPKYLKRTRDANKKKDNYIYIASKAGFILIITIDPHTNNYMKRDRSYKILHSLRPIHDSIRSITPISKIAGAYGRVRGLLGLAGTELFCLYRDEREKPYSDNYRILTERFSESLYNIEVGTFEAPEGEEKNNIIFVGDSQGVLHARQFLGILTIDKLPEILFDKKRIFRTKMKDRIFGMVPITSQGFNSENKETLFQMALGLGNHEIIFLDLINKDYIVSDVIDQLGLNIAEMEPEPSALQSFIEKCIELARDAEYDLQLKYKLMTAIFNPSSVDNPIALRLLKEGLIDLFIELVYRLLFSSKRPVFLHLYRKLSDLTQRYNLEYDSKGKNKWLYRKIDDLLEDIDKFWIGGETYSTKLGDLYHLILTNEKNKKPLDRLICQACINDRSFAIENDSEISNFEICSICQFGKILFAADEGGNLHLLKLDLSRIAGSINIRDFEETIYKGHPPKAGSLKSNFIRKVFILPDKQWGVFLLQAGGIWIFPLENILTVDINKSPDILCQIIFDTIFNSTQSLLIEKDVFAYNIKTNTSNGKIYLSDRFNQLYELKLNNGIPDRLVKLFPHDEKLKEYNPIYDFDFLTERGIVFGDTGGYIHVLDLHDEEQSKELFFPTIPRFNVCYAWDNKTVVLGTEEGNILAFDFSTTQPFCKWSYKLPGSVRFIEKTDDNKLLIGGRCTKAIVIDPSGEAEDYIDFGLFNRWQNVDDQLSINSIYPLASKKRYPGQRLIFLAGNQRGSIKTFRIYQPKIFEDEIWNFFFSSDQEPSIKVKMRCINIQENSLRRLYTAFESGNWGLDRIQAEIERLTYSEEYRFHAGPLLHLVPRFFSKFVTQDKEPKSGQDFQDIYHKFQNTVNMLITSWGIKNNNYCQQVLKTLGVNLFKIMVNKPLMAAIDNIIQKSTLPNLRSPRELMEEVRVHCIPIILIIMYEEVISVLSEIKGNLYLETAVDFICQKLRGRTFDQYIPDPLLHKKVEVLAFMVDKLGHCPIILCYKLFEENADIPIFYHLIHKVSDHRYKTVFESAHRFGTKLHQFDDISDVLSSINGFKDMFPEKFEEERDVFYPEFSFIFDRAQKILNFSDAMDIVASYRLTGYNEDGKYFKELIRWLNEIIEKVSGMKKIFQESLTQTRDTLIPRYDLVMLRAYFKELSNKGVESFQMGEIYGYFLMAIIEHLTNILSVFCEVRLPILSLENTATFLDNYLDEIRRKEQPLPALDNPDTLDNYNHFFRNMFRTIIVGMCPQHACFQYPTIENFKLKNHFEIYTHKKKIFDIKSEDEMSSLPGWIDADAKNIEDIFLYLPDNNHEYGKYSFLFLESDIDHPQFKEKISRFRGFVSVLNLYIMAFNGMTEAEMQSRFTHRLFAHQSKEPMLALRNQLKVLEDENFWDPGGTTTKEYHERMLRLVEQMLNRCDFILNVRKLFRHVKPALSKFRLNSMVDDVVKNMRKVMKDICCEGNVLIEVGPDLDIEIYSDESKLREILEQLIRNSIKYCKAVRHISVGIVYDRRNLYFKVSDNGVGIPEEEMPYIFTPYFRGEYGETNNIDGDGLGLWVAKTYASILGGEITPQNKYDSKNQRNGTSFTLIIPREFKEKDKREVKNEQPG